MHRKHLESRLVTIGGRCSKVSVSSPTSGRVLDQEVRAVEARPGEFAPSKGGVRLEVLTQPVRMKPCRLLQSDVLALRRLLEVRRRDLERRRQRLESPGSCARHRAGCRVHQQVGRNLSIERLRRPARADAVGLLVAARRPRRRIAFRRGRYADASMLGAPCWPLKCCTSAVNESCRRRRSCRVLACVALSANV